MSNRSPQEFQRQTRTSSAEAAVAVEAETPAGPLEPLDVVVAVVDGAGVLPSEFDEMPDCDPVSWVVVPLDAIFGRDDCT